MRGKRVIKDRWVGKDRCIQNRAHYKAHFIKWLSVPNARTTSHSTVQRSSHTYIHTYHIIHSPLFLLSSPLYQIKQTKTNKNKHSLQSLFSCTPTPQYSTHSTLQSNPTQPNPTEQRSIIISIINQQWL